MFSPHLSPIHSPRDEKEVPERIARIPAMEGLESDPHDSYAPSPEEREEPAQPLNWMCKAVITVRPDESLGELARVLDAHGISGVPVVDHEERLVGVVSQSDLAHYLARLRQSESRTSQGFYQGIFCNSWFSEPGLRGLLQEGQVSEILTPHSYWVSPETSLEEIMDLMLSQRIHRLPVLAEGRLVGVVTTLDVLAQIRNQAKSRTSSRPS